MSPIPTCTLWKRKNRFFNSVGNIVFYCGKYRQNLRLAVSNIFIAKCVELLLLLITAKIYKRIPCGIEWKIRRVLSFMLGIIAVLFMIEEGVDTQFFTKRRYMSVHSKIRCVLMYGRASMCAYVHLGKRTLVAMCGTHRCTIVECPWLAAVHRCWCVSLSAELCYKGHCAVVSGCATALWTWSIAQLLCLRSGL